MSDEPNNAHFNEQMDLSGCHIHLVIARDLMRQYRYEDEDVFLRALERQAEAYYSPAAVTAEATDAESDQRATGCTSDAVTQTVMADLHTRLLLLMERAAAEEQQDWEEYNAQPPIPRTQVA